MKLLLIIILLILIGIAGFLAYSKFMPKSAQTVGTSETISCIDGQEGNSGDNFCSNFHGGSSKCQPGIEGNYPDGCTK